MKQLTILGSGAAPGVPSLGRGWGACDPQNPKNRRLRTSAYLEYDGVRLLIDTSPDLRLQLLANDIRYLDGVLYTHAHAGLADVLAVIERINPEKAVINHMATECDYNQVMLETPENVVPAYDNMKIVIED